AGDWPSGDSRRARGSARRSSVFPYSSRATTSPSCTVCPSWTLISFTAPARGASTGISIFIDSSTITASPAATRSPGLVAIWNTTPVMCALISSGIEGSLFEHLRVHAALPELGTRDDPTQERDRGPDSLDDAPIQRVRQTRDRISARRPVGDQLEEQRIVMHGHRAPGLDPGLDPDALSRRQLELLNRPRGRQEALRRVFSIHAALDRRAPLHDLVLPPRQSLARGRAQLGNHEIETGHLFCDWMLHLEPRVHLQEIESPALVDEELHRASARLAYGARLGDRGA